MRTTVDIPDKLFWQLKARAAEENISLKVLVEKTAYLPAIGDGIGSVLVDPSTWWEAINERS